VCVIPPRDTANNLNNDRIASYKQKLLTETWSMRVCIITKLYLFNCPTNIIGYNTNNGGNDTIIVGT